MLISFQAGFLIFSAMIYDVQLMMDLHYVWLNVILSPMTQFPHVVMDFAKTRTGESSGFGE